MKRPEILAPAGSLESLRGAIAAGADAVYIGGTRFGARAYADNPSEEELKEAIDYVHLRGKKIYMTVNTLLKEKELEEELYPYLKAYYEQGVDAIIVQDPGVLHFLGTAFPDLSLHVSTQMTVVSGTGTKLFRDYPVTRIVPARELTLQEVRELRRATDLEIEMFVHGALCYCYSGQCLFSSMIGGRSGNRGRCAQPCRMEYSLMENGRRVRDGYLLSPKDLCSLEQIPELVEAGIDSFKIEGRMKRPEYTAGMTAAYRRLTELYASCGADGYAAYLKKHPELLVGEMERAAELYNRGGFTRGYYVQYHGAQMMSIKRPNHSGIPVGTVETVNGITAGIKIDRELQEQDVLEIRGREGTYEFTVGKNGLLQWEAARRQQGERALYRTRVTPGFLLRQGQTVYRTRNEQFLLEIRKKYLEKKDQVPVRGQLTAKVGEPLKMTLTAEIPPFSEITVFGKKPSPAHSQPVTEEQMEEQLRRTGESECFFTQLTIRCEENIFVPMGWLKELRRNAWELLRAELLSGFRRTAGKAEKLISEEQAKRESTPELICLVSDRKQWQAVLQEPEVDTVYLDLQQETLEQQLALARETKQRGKKAFLVLPHIFRSKEQARYEQVLPLLKEGCFGFLVKSLEELCFLREQLPDGTKEMRLNYNLYVCNQWAKVFFRRAGAERFTASVELNTEELGKVKVSDCDLLIYGRLPLMVSAQCVRDNFLQCSHGQRTEGLSLRDRTGAEFPVRQVCSSCYNLIYNSACLSLLGQTEEIRRLSPMGLRLDFTTETEQEVHQVLAALRRGEDEKTKGPLTRGHWRRGVQ